ncbi:MAG: hypothetical protein NXI32_22870 [bacterium]|nr:hypothetical protein [bacterium]
MDELSFASEVLTPSESGGVHLMQMNPDLDIDPSNLSARFRICTPRVDREGEIIEPSGVDWTDYANTGVVKYEHGFTGIPLPIAKSIDQNGVLHVQYDFEEDAIYARAFHSQRDELSYQMFGLIEEGFLRAASIHVLPLPEGSHQAPDGRTYAGASQMIEWSECTVGVNPDAYAKALTKDSKLSQVLHLQMEASERILAKGSVGGQRLLPTLAKCLRAVRPGKTQTIVNGVDLMSKSLTKEQVNKLSALGLAKALSEPSKYDSDTLKLLRFKAKSLDEMDKGSDEEYAAKSTDEETGMAKADTDEEMAKMQDEEAMAKTSLEEETVAKADDIEDEDVDDDDLPTGSKPMGAEVMSASHEKLAEFLGNCEAAIAQVENPQVIEAMQSVCDNLRAELATIEGAYSSIYPDQDALASTGESPDEEMVKSWVKENANARFQLAGMAARLGTILKDKKLDGKAKSLIQTTVRDLSMLQSRAKSYKSKQNSGWTPEETARVEKIEKVLDTLIDKFAKQPA